MYRNVGHANLCLGQYRLRVERIDRHATYTESCAIHFCVLFNEPRQNLPERSRERKEQVPPKSGNLLDQLAGQTPLRRYEQPAVNRQPGYRWGTRKASLQRNQINKSENPDFSKIRSGQTNCVQNELRGN